MVQLPINLYAANEVKEIRVLNTHQKKKKPTLYYIELKSGKIP